MTNLWLPIIAIIGGFIGLIWSADRFVAGSASLANNFGVSKLIIGLTIVAFGTSAPEIVVSLSASLQNAGDLAVGNALGSNLANIGLVLGATALIASLPIQRHQLQLDIPILLFVTALAGWFLFDATLSHAEGWTLLAILPCVMGVLIWSKRNHPEDIEDDIETLSNTIAIGWFLLGLAVLIGSSKFLVWGASELALAFGVSPLVIGLSVVAVGTSLPELAASIISALKGHYDIAIGNVIGSNLFNLLVVMAIPGIISEPVMDEAVFTRDFLALAIISGLFAITLFIDFLRKSASNNAHLGKIIGIILLLSYGSYYTILFG